MHRIVFIGFGRRAKTIYNAFSKRNDVSLVGFYDPYLENIPNVAPRRFSSIGTMVTQAQPDLIVISTPPRNHIKALRTCNKYGIDVMCEKPLSHSAKSLKEIEQMNIKIYPAYQLNFDWNIENAYAISAEQNIYQIISSQRVSLKPDGWKCDKSRSGGGTLIDNASHFINMALLRHGEPTQAFGTFRSNEHGIDIIADINLYYPQFTFSIHTDWLSPVGKENNLTIRTEKTEVIFSETNQSKLLVSKHIVKNGSHTILSENSHYISKGQERDLGKDPFNNLAERNALDNMIDKILADLHVPGSKYSRQLLEKAIITNKIIDKIYKHPGKLINL